MSAASVTAYAVVPLHSPLSFHVHLLHHMLSVKLDCAPTLWVEIRTGAESYGPEDGFWKPVIRI